MAEIHDQLLGMVQRAALTEEELRIFEDRVRGRRIDDLLLHEARHLITSLIKARSNRFKPNPQLLESLNILFNQEELRRRIKGDWENSMDQNDVNNYVSGRKPVPQKIAPNDAYHHSSTDSAPPCPHCYSTHNQSQMGELIVDGSPRPAYRCGSCNKVYSDLPTPVKILMDAAVKEGAESVGFRSIEASAEVQNLSFKQDDSQVIQANLKLDTLNNNTLQLLYAVQSLSAQLMTVTQQNSELMNKLATDPLIHIRKAVSEFDLK